MTAYVPQPYSANLDRLDGTAAQQRAAIEAVGNDDNRLSCVTGVENLSLFYERLLHASTGVTGANNYRVGIVTCGDSLAARIAGWLQIYTAEDFPSNQGRGLGNVTNPLVSPPNSYFPATGSRGVSTGDASRLVNQHNLWPDGLVYDMGSTGVVTFPPEKVVTPQIWAADNRSFTTIKVCYIKASGAGSFDIETSPNGSTWTKRGSTISASNATTVGAVETITLTQGVYHVRVKHVSGGRVNVIGVYTGFANSVSGVDCFDMSYGGITQSQFASTPLAIVTPILADLDPALITFHFADLPTEYTAKFADCMAIARAGNPERSVLWVASHSYYAADQALADSYTETISEFLRSKVESDKIAVLDLWTLFGNYSNIVAKGWEGDGVHMDWRLYAQSYEQLELSAPLRLSSKKRVSLAGVAYANTSNTFSGNQTVNGVMTANTFAATASGSVLTGSNFVQGTDLVSRVIFEGDTGIVGLTGLSFIADSVSNGPSISRSLDGVLLVCGATSGVRINNSNNTVELFRIRNNGHITANLPTSNPGPGILWNDGGTVKVGT